MNRMSDRIKGNKTKTFYAKAPLTQTINLDSQTSPNLQVRRRLEVYPGQGDFFFPFMPGKAPVHSAGLLSWSIYKHLTYKYLLQLEQVPSFLAFLHSDDQYSIKLC